MELPTDNLQVLRGPHGGKMNKVDRGETLPDINQDLHSGAMKLNYFVRRLCDHK